MVTSEFYAWVTAAWITQASERAELIRDKRPVGGWLRSSRCNSADQSGIVIESLYKFSGRVGLRLRGVQTRQLGRICLVSDARDHEKFAGCTYSSVMFSVPLSELGLQYVVDVHAD